MVRIYSTTASMSLYNVTSQKQFNNDESGVTTFVIQLVLPVHRSKHIFEALLVFITSCHHFLVSFSHSYIILFSTELAIK